MALAFFPQEKIPRVYKMIKESIPETLEELLGPFFAYYENEWLTVIKPQRFSVHNQEHRTNNFSEASNRKINANVAKRPPPGVFLGN